MRFFCWSLWRSFPESLHLSEEQMKTKVQLCVECCSGRQKIVIYSSDGSRYVEEVVLCILCSFHSSLLFLNLQFLKCLCPMTKVTLIFERKKNTTTTNREKIIFKSNETMLIRNKEECWSFIIQVWKIALKCSTSHTSYMQLSKISIGLFILGERGKINSYINKKPMREDLQLWKLPSYLSFFWVLKLLSVY